MFVAQNPKSNASINEGHRLQGILQAERASTNPRLYANEAGGAQFHPETDSQDNSDLPMFMSQLTDSLQSLGQDPNVPIYLQVWVAEKQNLYDVAMVLAIVDKGGSLDSALA